MKLITIKAFKGDAYSSWALPKEIEATKESRISAQFEYGTHDTLRGFTFEEEKLYLPNLLGTSVSDPQWAAKTLEFWASYSVIIPSEGLVLNIDTYPEGHPRAGYPENIQQYITYRFLLKHSAVAKNKTLVEWPKHKFYILDETVVVKENTAAFELRNRANKAFMFLQTDKAAAKLEWVAMCLKDKLDKLPVTNNELLMFIESKKDAVKDNQPVGLTNFLNVFNDDNLEQKALLYKLLSLGVVEKNGNSYFFQGEVMGNEIEAIHWLKNPVNSKSLLQMNERLKSTIV